MTTIEFKPWHLPAAVKHPEAVRGFLQDAADSTLRLLRTGMLGPKTGRVYKRKSGTHRASAANEYPARDGGALFSSAGSVVKTTQEQTGTSRPYSIYLKTGTRKMRARRMSDQAHREAMPGVRARMKAFAGWQRGT